MRGGTVRTTLLAIALATIPAAQAKAAELLPDADMREPSDIALTTDGGRTFVEFESRVDNLGPGALKLLGQRPDTSSPTMSATQVLLDQNGSVARAIPNAGFMEFSPAGGHDHWHYLRFEDYMLLSVPNLDFVAPTRKTGFCLSGLNPSFSCGRNTPNRLQIGDPAEGNVGAPPVNNTEAMGLTAPGAGVSFDIYDPSVEGQDIEITAVPDGRYCLAFVANPEERIVETTTANNGSSRLIEVGTAAGGARTLALSTSYPDSSTCGITTGQPTGGPGPGGSPAPGGGSSPSGESGAPSGGTGTGSGDGPGGGAAGGPTTFVPFLTKHSAAKLTRSALKQKFRSPQRLSRACRLRAVRSASCRVSFLQSGARYKGTVGIKETRRAGEWQWFYAITVKRTRRGGCRSCPVSVRTKTLLGGVLGVNRAAARRALREPATAFAPKRAGAAWPAERLCRLTRASLAQRKPVG